MDLSPKVAHTQKLVYDRGVQKVEKHFVQEFGATSQHGAVWKDYEEGGEENDTILDIHNFGDDENSFGSLVGG